jgi:hypothetical protein
MRNHTMTALFVLSTMTLAPLAHAQEAANAAEFTLTDFRDASSGLSFKRPTSWTQNAAFKPGVRFEGGDEWLTVQLVKTVQTPQAYLATFKVPASEKAISTKPFKQGTFNALVQSSSAQGQSGVTGKPVSLHVDRWVFAPRAGQLAVLTVSGPQKVFDWEGNRDMALSLRLK